MKGLFEIFFFFGFTILSSYAGKCQEKCSSLIHDVLSMEICRDARKLYPRPRVGNACSDGMESAFYDYCVPTCLGIAPENRIWQACKKASDELPKPTMGKWCEHGYREGYRASTLKLEGYMDVLRDSSGSAQDL